MTLTAILTDFFVAGPETADALPSHYNYVLVLVSYVVASLASYTFLQFAGRIVELRQSVMRYAWFAAGAIMMGLGVWAMHFVGMLAYILPIPIAYDIVPTFLSVIPAVLAAAIALHVVARPTVSMRHLLIGGTLMGAGIGIMHYGGMEAISVNAIVRYDPLLFGTSIVAAVLLSILALQVRFWVGRRKAGQSPDKSVTAPQEIVAAMILGFAVTAMHYTAMASTYCFATPGSHPFAFDAHVLAGVTAVIASLVLLMAIAAVAFDRRMKSEIAMRVKADENVAAEMARLNSVFQTTGAGIVMLDREGQVVMANRFVLSIFGKTADEVIGRSYAEMDLTGIADVLNEWQAASGADHLKAVEYERNITYADGSKRIVKVTANPAQDEAGRLSYVVMIGVDDTERRLAEIRLFDSSRLANLGEMATGMAHEINQPLAVIRMAADSVIEELECADAATLRPDLAEFLKAKLARISSQTERASNLVNELRTVARKPTNDARPFDVAEAMRVSRDLLAEQLKAARIDFTVDLPPPGQMVRGEASRLQQVIINLALNARDALLGGAERSSTGALGHIVLRAAADRTGNVSLTIEDDGPGIPAHVLPRLFEPFFTTKAAGKGTGLGLSISYGIVKRMGGEISAANRPEGGARFTIVLPPAEAASPEMQEAA